MAIHSRRYQHCCVRDLLWPNSLGRYRGTNTRVVSSSPTTRPCNHDQDPAAAQGHFGRLPDAQAMTAHRAPPNCPRRVGSRRTNPCRTGSGYRNCGSRLRFFAEAMDVHQVLPNGHGIPAFGQLSLDEVAVRLASARLPATRSARGSASGWKRSSAGSRPSPDCGRPGIEVSAVWDGCSPSPRRLTIWFACETWLKLS
jgi:hypothetical protein